MSAHCSPEIVTNNNDTSVELFDGLSHTVDHLREKETDRVKGLEDWNTPKRQ
jgi:hypothetical protein